MSDVKSAAIAATITEIHNPLIKMQFMIAAMASLKESEGQKEIIAIFALAPGGECECGETHDELLAVGMLNGTYCTIEDAAHVCAFYLTNHSDRALQTFAVKGSTKDLASCEVISVSLDRAKVSKDTESCRAEFDRIINNQDNFPGEEIDGDVLRNLADYKGKNDA